MRACATAGAATAAAASAAQPARRRLERMRWVLVMQNRYQRPGPTGEPPAEASAGKGLAGRASSSMTGVIAGWIADLGVAGQADRVDLAGGALAPGGLAEPLLRRLLEAAQRLAVQTDLLLHEPSFRALQPRRARPGDRRLSREVPAGRGLETRAVYSWCRGDLAMSILPIVRLGHPALRGLAQALPPGPS